MTSRNPGGVQENLNVGVAAENVLTVVQPDAAVYPFHEEGHFASRDAGAGSLAARDATRNA